MTVSFNKAQLSASLHSDGPMLVLAGPGSGKTTVIVQRIQNLIHRFHVPPAEILVVTFSRAAAQEMQARFIRAEEQTANTAHPVSKETSKNKNPSHTGASVNFGTLHSVFFGILKDELHYSSDNILRPSLKTAIIRTELEKHAFPTEDLPALCQKLSGLISICKDSGSQEKLPEDLPVSASLFQEIFHSYQKECSRRRLIDFDDMLLQCLHLLKTKPAVCRKWQERFRYILVDEFQDINRVQYDILCLLAGTRGNLFVVGDDDQSIYGFRGAEPRIMKQFLHDFPGAGQVLLSVNYRCQREILQKSLQLISLNTDRFSKKLQAARNDAKEKHVVCISSYTSQEEELSAITEKIRRLLAQGMPPESIAVLFRNVREASLLAENLFRKNIPYSMKEKPMHIFSNFIAQDLIAYMKAAGPSCSRQDFIRIMNRPLRYISREVPEAFAETALPAAVRIRHLKRFYRHNPGMQKRLDKLDADLKFLAGCTPFAAIHYIKHAIGYEDYINQYAKENHIARESCTGLLQPIEESAKAFTTFAQWFSYIERYTETVRESNQKTETGNGIRIMTMHAAKGLEFTTVFLPCINQGIMPHHLARTKADFEEERRLFYVAMTRAKDHLYISWAETIRHKHFLPSEYLNALL